MDPLASAYAAAFFYGSSCSAGFLGTCLAFVRANNTGAFLAACANVALIALIDEATGCQTMWANDALQVKLKAYLEEDAPLGEDLPRRAVAGGRVAHELAGQRPEPARLPGKAGIITSGYQTSTD